MKPNSGHSNRTHYLPKISFFFLPLQNINPTIIRMAEHIRKAARAAKLHIFIAAGPRLRKESSGV
jgi:hypothetical protein